MRVLDRGVLQRTQARQAGVVDQHVHAAVVLENGFDLDHVGVFLEVGSQHAYIDAMGLGELFGERGEAVRTTCDQDEIVAAGGQSLGIDGADARGSTGNDGRFLGRGHDDYSTQLS